MDPLFEIKRKWGVAGYPGAWPMGKAEDFKIYFPISGEHTIKAYFTGNLVIHKNVRCTMAELKTWIMVGLSGWAVSHRWTGMRLNTNLVLKTRIEAWKWACYLDWFGGQSWNIGRGEVVGADLMNRVRLEIDRVVRELKK